MTTAHNLADIGGRTRWRRFWRLVREAARQLDIDQAVSGNALTARTNPNDKSPAGQGEA